MPRAKKKPAAKPKKAAAKGKPAVKPKKAAAKRKSAARPKKAAAKRREQPVGQHIGYRYDVNLLPDPAKITPFLRRYIAAMGWKDLNWLEDVHMGYEEGRPAVFDRNINGWVTVPGSVRLPADQQGRDMIARELLVKFQMSPRHPLVDLKKAYGKL